MEIFYLEHQTSASSNNLVEISSVKLLFARSSIIFIKMRNPKSRRAKLRTEPVNKRQRVDIAPVDSKDDFFQVKSFTAVVESSFKSFWYVLQRNGHSVKNNTFVQYRMRHLWTLFG